MGLQVNQQGKKGEGTLTMQTYGPTARMMETRDSGEVTSIDTARLDFLVRIMDSRRFVRGLVVLEANVSYEDILNERWFWSCSNRRILIMIGKSAADRKSLKATGTHHNIEPHSTNGSQRKLVQKGLDSEKPILLQRVRIRTPVLIQPPSE